MQYPIFMTTHGKVDEFFFPNLFRDDSVFFDRPDLRRYYKHYHNQTYEDVNGNLFKSVGIYEISSRLSREIAFNILELQSYNYHRELPVAF